mmetsp:Transcript_47895/g.102681  ORF Transcript_47895/g.102681 Transcript_47895/m.102681 type:complete len:86 (+) Transcript_47895:47-304(+)
MPTPQPPPNAVLACLLAPSSPGVPCRVAGAKLLGNFRARVPVANNGNCGADAGAGNGSCGSEAVAAAIGVAAAAALALEWAGRGF